MTVDLSTFPTYLGNALGVDAVAGGILATVFLMMITIFFLAYLTRGKMPMLLLCFAMLDLGFGVVVQWLPPVFLVIIFLVSAASFAAWVKGGMG
jgi:uncharacterized membrane protein